MLKYLALSWGDDKVLKDSLRLHSSCCNKCWKGPTFVQLALKFQRKIELHGMLAAEGHIPILIHG